MALLLLCFATQIGLISWPKKILASGLFLRGGRRLMNISRTENENN